MHCKKSAWLAETNIKKLCSKDDMELKRFLHVLADMN